MIARPSDAQADAPRSGQMWKRTNMVDSAGRFPEAKILNGSMWTGQIGTLNLLVLGSTPSGLTKFSRNCNEVSRCAGLRRALRPGNMATDPVLEPVDDVFGI